MSQTSVRVMSQMSDGQASFKNSRQKQVFKLGWKHRDDAP